MELIRYRDQSDIKVRILQQVFRRGAISRIELAEELRVSPATITKFVRSLLQEGVIVEGELIASGIGRKPINLNPNPHAGAVLAIDIGAWYVRVAVVDFSCTLLDSARFLSEEITPETLLSHLQPWLSQLVKRKGIGIAVGVSGLVDRETGSVLFCPNIPRWNGICIRSLLEEASGLPVLVEPSARFMAHAESRIGAGIGVQDQLTVSIGYGIGAGLVFNGRLYSGQGGHAGELGHVQVEENGTRCTCGNYGCLENYVTYPLILEHIQERMRRYQGYSPLKLLQPDPDKVTETDLQTALQQGDRLVTDEMESTGKRIGVALANMANMLNPGRIILNGGVVALFPELVDIAARTVRERCLTPVRKDLTLVRSELGWKSALLGGALSMLDVFVQRES